MARFLSSRDLVARMERAEAALIGGAARAAAARLGPSAVLRCELAGGVAVHAGADSPFNKVAGLGFGGAPRESELERLEQAFDERRTPLRVELASHADPTVAAVLARRGYALSGFEDVLALELPAQGLPTLPAAIAVRRALAAEDAFWLSLLVRGFAQPDARGVASDERFESDVLEAALTDLSAAGGFERFTADLDGRPAGAAGLRLADGVATLCGAATLREQRGRGVQTALLAARLEHAARAGCDLAMLTTQPGSTSQHNALRQGFRLVYTRAVLLRPGE